MVDAVLARLLLDEGRVDSAALDQASQQQLLRGGAFDTMLWELGLVDIDVMAAALAKAHRTAPVPASWWENPSAGATVLVPAASAVAARACPVAVEDGALHVLCAAPVDTAALAQWAERCHLPVVPHVVPELRVWQALQRAYAVSVDERVGSLLLRLSPSPVIVASAAATAGREDAPPCTWDLSTAIGLLTAETSRDGIIDVAITFARKHMPFAAVFGVRDGLCHGWRRSGDADNAAFGEHRVPLPDDSMVAASLRSAAPLVGRPPLTPGNDALFAWLGRRRPRTFFVAPILVGRRPVGALVADGGIRAKELPELADLVGFGARLGGAFEWLLHKRRQANPTLFVRPAPEPVLQSESPQPPPPPPRAAAQPAPAPMQVDDEDSDKRRRAGAPQKDGPPKDGTSPFARHYKPPERGGEIDRAVDRAWAESAVLPQLQSQRDAPGLDNLLPKRTRLSTTRGGEETASAAKAKAAEADGAGSKSTFARLTDDKAPQAWRGALVDTVERGHQGGEDDESGRLFVEENAWRGFSGVPDPKHEDAPAAELLQVNAHAPSLSLPTLSQETLIALVSAEEAPTRPGVTVKTLLAAEPAPGPAPDLSGGVPARSPEEWVDDLLGLDERVVAAATEAVVDCGAAAIPALVARFPGRLRVDPFDPGTHVRRAEQLGALVDTCFRMGIPGLDVAARHLDARFPAHRFAAVLLFALTPDDRAIDLLRARIHDHEPRVRGLAVEALLPFVGHPRFETVLAHLRERLHSPMIEARRRAVSLLGVFRDVAAAPVLIGLLDDKNRELAEEARRALRPITLQDHGARAKAWERWWQKAKKRSRVDWLIEGLMAGDRELRATAIVDLEQVAGTDFGYRPDATPKARQACVEQFQGWWLEEQRRL